MVLKVSKSESFKIWKSAQETSKNVWFQDGN